MHCLNNSSNDTFLMLFTLTLIRSKHIYLANEEDVIEKSGFTRAIKSKIFQAYYCYFQIF
jgi:hypothetical protein